jgi:hypothetical protein
LSKEELIEDLRIFLRSLSDAKLQNILEVGFESPHVLGAFKSILAKDKDELVRLEAFLKERSKERLLLWLTANALVPLA